ncbi:hypothetical protein [Brevibacillus laterosporus]|nr:hypothetical protein [Brevibacillus laterosporus]
MLQKDTIVYGENNEEFLVENLLGNGAFGVVYEIKKKYEPIERS